MLHPPKFKQQLTVGRMYFNLSLYSHRYRYRLTREYFFGERGSSLHAYCIGYIVWQGNIFWGKWGGCSIHAYCIGYIPKLYGFRLSGSLQDTTWALPVEWGGTTRDECGASPGHVVRTSHFWVSGSNSTGRPMSQHTWRLVMTEILAKRPRNKWLIRIRDLWWQWAAHSAETIVFNPGDLRPEISIFVGSSQP